ncbi:hypothetical protein ETD86_11140 [Nonomuraea turkmeniaca]|uniref:Uncharacterized protein n=1 Tax=Nonomuraea turkmeniaca TaxID=103838 RepID=A0A5S4FPA4_9ACTN|nr:hypothetical protein [Nonomuraea turkmeniaca]TMR22543.1 hypothetical protein ETD86_11140 [Nonomuraea turkmeniaca]
MTKSTAIMELVAGYDTYAQPGELQVSAISDAPELWFTIWAISYGVRVSSAKCAIWASAASGAVSGWILNR